MIQIELGNASAFGWFIIAIATTMTIGIYVAYKKWQVIRVKYVIAVIVMFAVGVKWLLDN